MNVVPAIVSVPVRFVVTVFGATLKPTLPPPLPVAPLVIVIQLALLAADQAQPDPADTVLDPGPPPAPNDCETGEMEREQGAENEKVLVRGPPLRPPGPNATTTAS